MRLTPICILPLLDHSCAAASTQAPMDLVSPLPANKIIIAEDIGI